MRILNTSSDKNNTAARNAQPPPQRKPKESDLACAAALEHSYINRKFLRTGSEVGPNSALSTLGRIDPGTKVSTPVVISFRRTGSSVGPGHSDVGKGDPGRWTSPSRPNTFKRTGSYVGPEHKQKESDGRDFVGLENLAKKKINSVHLPPPSAPKSPPLSRNPSQSEVHHSSHSSVSSTPDSRNEFMQIFQKKMEQLQNGRLSRSNSGSTDLPKVQQNYANNINNTITTLNSVVKKLEQLPAAKATPVNDIKPTHDDVKRANDGIKPTSEDVKVNGTKTVEDTKASNDIKQPTDRIPSGDDLKVILTKQLDNVKTDQPENNSKHHDAEVENIKPTENKVAEDNNVKPQEEAVKPVEQVEADKENQQQEKVLKEEPSAQTELPRDEPKERVEEPVKLATSDEISVSESEPESSDESDSSSHSDDNTEERPITGLKPIIKSSTSKSKKTVKKKVSFCDICVAVSDDGQITKEPAHLEDSWSDFGYVLVLPPDSDSESETDSEEDSSSSSESEGEEEEDDDEIERPIKSNGKKEEEDDSSSEEVSTDTEQPSVSKSAKKAESESEESEEEEEESEDEEEKERKQRKAQKKKMNKERKQNIKNLFGMSPFDNAPPPMSDSD